MERNEREETFILREYEEAITTVMRPDKSIGPVPVQGLDQMVNTQVNSTPMTPQIAALR
jgi:hypothetical protein